MITKEQFQKLKNLAMIDFANNEEEQKVFNQLQEIINFLNQLDQVDLSWIEDINYEHSIHLEKWVNTPQSEDVELILKNAKNIEWHAIVI